MSTRYWVGGASTNAWGATSPKTNWGTASNTQDNASVPTSSDDVIFNGAGTGALNCSLSADASCGSINFTGYSNTISSASSSYQLNVFGTTVTLSSGMTCSNLYLDIHTATGTVSFTSNGKTLKGLVVDGTNAVISLQDALSIGSGGITLGSCTFTTNNYNVNAAHIYSNYDSETRTLNLGSSTITLNAAEASYDSKKWAWHCGTTATVNAGTSTIYVTGEPIFAERHFYGGGYTYYNLKFSARSTYASRIWGSSTYNVIEQESSSARSSIVEIEAGTLNTVSGLTISGYDSSHKTTLSSITLAQHTLTKSSGSVSVSNVTIVNSKAIGGATFNAAPNGVDGGGNSGWTFGSIFTYSGDIGIALTILGQTVDYDGFTYSGNIGITLEVDGDVRKNNEYVGEVGILLTPTYSRTIAVSDVGSVPLAFGVTSGIGVDLVYAGSIPIGFTIDSDTDEENAGYIPYAGQQIISLGMSCTYVTRKKLLTVKDPVVIGGCPQCGTLVYNR